MSRRRARRSCAWWWISAPVRSQEPGDLAGRDREAEVVYRQDRPVALGEMTNLDHRAGTLGCTRLAAGAADGHEACGLSRCFCHFSCPCRVAELSAEITRVQGFFPAYANFDCPQNFPNLIIKYFR